MNYRHAFHAGNFADLVKHAGLTLLLEAMTRGPEPLTLIDTHAGAGAYDLAGEMALKSGEAAIDRLLADDDAPEAFDILKAAVVRANPGGGVRIYPGSPALICAALREDDRLVACELRPDDHAALVDLLAPLEAQAQARLADGFVTVEAEAPATGKLLVLIDPPFERGDDYQRVVAATGKVLVRNAGAVVAIWTPLKDLETFDRFLRGLEGIDPPSTLVAEVRLRPLADPMKMNGCALVVVNAEPGLDVEMQAICGWIAGQLGETGGEARIWRL
ncbi:23S rRNA (adenine(2030)-N(6))-methyltransferase RlmJ [soil metagenome]